MSRTPNREFLLHFDLELARRHHVQRLQPGIVRLHDDLLPRLPDESANDRIAALFELLGTADRTEILNSLLAAEVVSARFYVQRVGDDLEFDSHVRDVIGRLLRIVCEPAGGSALAAQRAAEIGTLLPSAFLDSAVEVLTKHPAGFRVFRPLAQFAFLIRLHHPTNRAGRSVAEIHARASDVLARISATRDPYPGQEWSIGFGRERLLGVQSKQAAVWLNSIVESTDATLRARVHAFWCLRSGMPSFQAAEFDASAKRDPWVLAWSESATRARTWEEAELEVRERLGTAGEKLSQAATRSCQTHSVPEELRHSFESLFEAMIMTPDGALRRVLVEAFASAGLAVACNEALLEVAADRSFPESFRETAVFLLARLREPDPRTSQLIVRAFRQKATFRGTAAWAAGDIWHSSLDAGERASLRNALVSAAIGSSRHATQALHALQVSLTLDPDDGSLLQYLESGAGSGRVWTEREEALLRWRQAAGGRITFGAKTDELARLIEGPQLPTPGQ